ncbi:hypothetical protein AGMMS4956_06650 [Bacteroidia bacterium]|nr:hypothetical protein AGMMS4956_06650 [Bacteroidia bacterium]
MLLTLTVWAQQASKVDIEGQKKRIAKNDEAIANPKKESNPKTWIERGDLFQKFIEEQINLVRPGTSKLEAQLMLGEPKEKGSTKTIGNATYEVWTYPTKEVYFEGEKVVFWQYTDLPAPDLLFTAKQAYEKAIELDIDSKNTKKIKKELQSLAETMKLEGSCALTAQDYIEAQRYFMASADCQLNPIVGVVDTLMIYYSAYLSQYQDIADYDNAIKYFNLCLQHNYFDGGNGNVYALLAEAYASQKDTEQQRNMLLTGFEKFPTSKEILVALINLYLSSGEDPIKIIDLLKAAEGNDPTNASLHFVEGTLYEKLEKMDDAIRSYEKSVEIDPLYFNGYYNLAVLYNNKGVEYITESTKIKNWKDPKIKELQNLANEQYKKSLEIFLKAHEVDPKEKFTIDNIKNIYYRFSDEQPEMMKGYEEFKAKSDALNQ